MTAMDEDPTFAPWDGRRVPVTLVGGYLGSGKTTLINEVLARTDQPIAILVNDVGEINIDARLIARQSGDVVELTDGCVCCSLAAGLVAAFEGLRNRETPPEHVIVELSGVAAPNRVLQWTRSPGFRLDAVIVVVDGEQFIDRHDDPILAPLLEQQVRAADLIAISKADLVDSAALAAVRDRIQTLAPEWCEVTVGHVRSLAATVGQGSRRPGGIGDLAPSELFDPHVTETIPLADPISREALHDLVAALPADTIRAKAVARHGDGSSSIVHVVGNRTVVEPMPDAEAQAPTDLIVIRIPEDRRI